ncbi:MAG TPA: helix-turn-helix domain-containing protein [Allosphingosinicella sp.]
MIAGCIDRMRRDGCGGCERRDACSSIFKAFSLDPAGPRPAGAGKQLGSFLDHPFVSFLGQLAKLGARRPPPRERAFRREVEQRVEPLLASGAVRIERVARELGCSRQTLYRRLKAEGVTFEELLDSLRRRLAIRFLQKEGLSVKEAAYRLGFSDPSAFSRAFKRWTGSSPTAMRRG